MVERSHSITAEGTDVGIIGGLAVAIWFLILDTIAGRPMLTPSLLGQVVLMGDSTPDTSQVVFGAVLLYTAFHFVVFALLGMGLVALVHWGTENSVVRYALLPVFLAFEVMFYGVLEVLSEGTGALFPFWAVVSANTLAAVSMGAYLWIRHPAFRRSIQETPLGAAPTPLIGWCLGNRGTEDTEGLPRAAPPHLLKDFTTKARRTRRARRTTTFFVVFLCVLRDLRALAFSCCFSVASVPLFSSSGPTLLRRSAEVPERCSFPISIANAWSFVLRLPYIRRLLVLALLLPAGRLDAQLEPPSTGGVVALDQELRMLGHYRRVLMIGAHPDDEDTELLTVLVRGMGAEAAYLSLNRGEGGQNLIGPELGEALGLIRTEELLAARRLDGARQFFTRAYDFGYSKTIEETWEHWPQDTVLKDVVRIIRRYRPQIVVAVFSGEPKDGHGQHQAAGWVAREAFAAAGDSTRFTELAREEGIRTWTPTKLYRTTWNDTTATTLLIDSGVLDRAVGKSYSQIAMAGRSLHRSQDMGRPQEIGHSPIELALVEDRSNEGSGGLFDGVDTSLAAMPWRDAPNSDGPAARRRFSARADSARAALGAGSYRRVITLLDRGKRDLLPQSDDTRAQMLFSTPEQADQRRHTERALAIAAGLVADARSEDDRMIAGQSDSVSLSVWNAGPDSMSVAGGVVPSAEWHVQADSGTEMALAPGELRRATVTLRPDTLAPITTPYFLRQPAPGRALRLERRRPQYPGRAVRPDRADGAIRAAGHRRRGHARSQLPDDRPGDGRGAAAADDRAAGGREAGSRDRHLVADHAGEPPVHGHADARRARHDDRHDRTGGARRLARGAAADVPADRGGRAGDVHLRGAAARAAAGAPAPRSARSRATRRGGSTPPACSR